MGSFRLDNLVWALHHNVKFAKLYVMTVIKLLLVSDRTIFIGQGILLHYNSQYKAVISL